MTDFQFPPEGINLIDIPFPSNAGVWGVCPGQGPIASLIRHLTASWAGHAVMYIGNGKIVEATWPKVRLSPAPTNNVIWATGQPLSSTQFDSAGRVARMLVGSGYDLFVYPFLAAAVASATITRRVSPLFNSDRWWDCSGLIEHCDAVAGAPMFPGDAGSQHFVTPSQLMTLGAQKGWFQGQ